jgi:hypothetical protein
METNLQSDHSQATLTRVLRPHRAARADTFRLERKPTRKIQAIAVGYRPASGIAAMKSKTRYGLIAAAAALFVCAGLSGTIMSNVEQPTYTVIQSFQDVEIRDYPPMIVAEVEVSGERKEAINVGFRQIADYIFGNNSPKRKIPMTAPVTQQAGEKIAMTAPVSQQLAGARWKVRFVMPQGYTLETLPAPTTTR